MAGGGASGCATGNESQGNVAEEGPEKGQPVARGHGLCRSVMP
ncbi:MAG: hypothetical protein Q27BPR15_06735 [Rhodobacter sp. CACIA14H1]|nr:MAG: hypothetical protein Q27BPR15_06735 [Rhodobacter sp. CACIA14H1]